MRAKVGGVSDGVGGERALVPVQRRLLDSGFGEELECKEGLVG